MATFPELATRRITLAGAALDPPGFATYLAGAAARDELHVDGMNAAFAAVAALHEVVQLETRLAAADDARLEAFCRDSGPLVASAANFVFPP